MDKPEIRVEKMRLYPKITYTGLLLAGLAGLLGCDNPPAISSMTYRAKSAEVPTKISRVEDYLSEKGCTRTFKKYDVYSNTGEIIYKCEKETRVRIKTELGGGDNINIECYVVGGKDIKQLEKEINKIMEEKDFGSVIWGYADDPSKTVKEKNGTTLLVPLYDDSSKTVKEKNGTTLLVPLYDEKTQ